MDTRFERILGKVKGFRLNFSEKPSLDDKEGEEGEFRINKKNNKSDLYVKMDKKWAQLGLGITESNLTTNGYVKYGNGLIMQWGIQTATSATETVTFPIAFSRKCFNVILTDYLSTDTGGASDTSLIKTLPTKTQVEISCVTAVTSFFWQAIGH